MARDVHNFLDDDGPYPSSVDSGDEIGKGGVLLLMLLIGFVAMVLVPPAYTVIVTLCREASELHTRSVRTSAEDSVRADDEGALPHAPNLSASTESLYHI